LRSSKIIWNNI